MPALTVMEPPGPSPPVAVEMSPPSNIVSRGVLTVIAPALAVPSVRAVILLGLLTSVIGPTFTVCPLCPEIDTCSDAVTDTMPPGPEVKVSLAIEAPPVKVILAAWTFTSPAPPGPNELDAIKALPFMVRVGVETKTGPACPKPKVVLEMVLPAFCKTNGPRWKVPGRKPEMVIKSDALSCRLPVAPAPNVLLLISPRL